jgi:hypothetical protein
MHPPYPRSTALLPDDSTLWPAGEAHLIVGPPVTVHPLMVQEHQLPACLSSPPVLLSQ